MKAIEADFFSLLKRNVLFGPILATLFLLITITFSPSPFQPYLSVVDCPAEGYDRFQQFCSNHSLSLGLNWRSKLVNVTALPPIVALSVEPVRSTQSKNKFEGRITYTFTGIPLRPSGRAQLDHFKQIHSSLELVCGADKEGCEMKELGVFTGLLGRDFYLDVLLHNNGEFSSHMMELRFKAMILNPSFAIFFLVFKCMLFLASFIGGVLYLFRLSRSSVTHHTFEHGCIAWLSVLLVLLNEPWLYFAIVRPSPYAEIVTLLAFWSFLTALLLFWLEGFGWLRTESECVATKRFESRSVFLTLCVSVAGFTFALLSNSSGYIDSSLKTSLEKRFLYFLAFSFALCCCWQIWRSKDIWSSVSFRCRLLFFLSALLVVGLILAETVALRELHSKKGRGHLLRLLVLNFYVLGLQRCWTFRSASPAQ